ncbi:MAG TPA: polyphosphate kinase 1 [Saprospiraceae bacterium]|nr:polyphosphate kinase 1 [Saprospiraceae bacterium]
MIDRKPKLLRDISWLRFNYRVLQEAMNPEVPLFDRIKFLAIYSSNLDEFYSIRVANARNLVKLGKKTIKALDFEPKVLLKQIKNIVAGHHKIFSKTLNNEIIPELKRNGIFLLKPDELSELQRAYVDSYFHNQLISFVQPVLLNKNLVKPFLNDAELYLSLHLHEKGKRTGDNTYAIVKIPSDYFPRFIELPNETDRHNLILLDDIVRHALPYLFPGFDIIGSYSMKITRDAELYIDDEYTGDLLEKIRKSLIKRNVGPASRFVYDRSMPEHMLNYLVSMFEIDQEDIIQEGKIHNNFDFFKFPDFDLAHLKYKELDTIDYMPLLEGNLFDAIREKDHLIYAPFHSYEPVIRFFEEAAIDPDVSHIKITQYRVARQSRIMNALMDAVKNGKIVSAFIEVKARFDEEANIRWGEKLEAAGVKVQYSFPGLKVHSKMGMIRRIENGTPMLYSYMSTGNFHEMTAKTYCDFGFFTADPNLTTEVAKVFSFLETVDVPENLFEHLLVGQFNLRKNLTHYIDQEIRNAKKGKASEIILKMNSLEDDQMIQKLYEADQAGVKIKLIIRGINCLIPGVEKVSDHTEAISIVDRYLEHARVFVFNNNNNPTVLISSADWMVRNLSYRIETAFHIYDKDIKKTILDILDIQWADNVKARRLDGVSDSVIKKNDKPAFRSQEEIFKYLREKPVIEKSEKKISPHLNI